MCAKGPFGAFSCLSKTEAALGPRRGIDESATIAKYQEPGDFAVVGEILNDRAIAIMLQKTIRRFQRQPDSTIREG